MTIRDKWKNQRYRHKLNTLALRESKNIDCLSYLHPKSEQKPNKPVMVIKKEENLLSFFFSSKKLFEIEFHA